MSQAPQSLYVERAAFGAGQLTFDMSDGRAVVGTLQFEFVRSFLFVKESDFWADIEKVEKALIFPDAFAPRVHRVARRALTEAITAGRFNKEEPLTFLLWTADECFEIVCFAAPVWSRTEAFKDESTSLSHP